MTRLGPVDPSGEHQGFRQELSETAKPFFSRYITIPTPASLVGRISHGPDSNLSALFTRKVGESEGA